jgi:hypothetical protein
MVAAVPFPGRRALPGGLLSERLYTVAEAAEQLRVAPIWLYRRTRIRAVPHRRLGKLVRFTHSDIGAIIAAARARSASHPAS